MKRASPTEFSATPDMQRGAARVGLLSDLNAVEAGAVLYLRLWCDGDRALVARDFESALGEGHGRAACRTLDQLCALCVRHGRRQLMRHHLGCACLGADEACFANFVAAALDGDREDAMLIATLIVRAAMAPAAAAMAQDLGLALKCMAVRGRLVGRGTPAPQTRFH
jgi:hypothetical protein